MDRFRKKPVVIEAIQWHEGDRIEGVHYATSGCGHPLMMAHVHTEEGPLTVSDCDWIIKGVKGEYYPCKPDVFALTYRPSANGVLTPTGEMEEIAADLVSAWETAYNFPPGSPHYETSIFVPRLAKVPAQVILRPWMGVEQADPILQEVRAERLKQKARWNREYNAAHSPLDWHEMIADYNAWARRKAALGDDAQARVRYVQVAALAVAAIESLDDKTLLRQRARLIEEDAPPTNSQSSPNQVRAGEAKNG